MSQENIDWSKLWMTKNVRLRIYDVFIKELGNDQKDFDEESER